MWRIWAFLAICGLAISVIVHFGTYLGINIGHEFPLVWALHIGALGMFAVMGLSGFNEKLGIKRKEKSARRINWIKRLTEPAPSFIYYAVLLCFGYVIINFLLFFCQSWGTPFPMKLNGEYLLYRSTPSNVYIDTEDGDSLWFRNITLDNVPTVRSTENGITVFVEVTDDEYSEKTAITLRGFSGHWMFFFLIPAVFFLYHGDGKVKRKREIGLEQTENYDADSY